MGNAFSYLNGVLLNEKMSSTERKIGEAKALIKDASEKLKSNEASFNSMTDKKTQTAEKVKRSIEYWKKLIDANEAKIKELTRGVDAFKDHDPEELEKKFTQEKEKEKHAEAFSKMSDEDLQDAANDHQKNVDDLDDEEKKNIKNDPKHLAIQKELKKRQMQKIELKKIKAQSTETDAQEKPTDPKDSDPSKPTVNADNPNLPDPPANMTDGDNSNGGKEELPTDEKGWAAHKKNIENERQKAKEKHFANWAGDDLRPGVDPKKAEEDEKSYDIANKKNIKAGFAYSKWRDAASREKAEKERAKEQAEKEKPKVEPKEEPKVEPKVEPKEEPNKTRYKGEDKSHPLNFDSIEDFKQHHREKASSSDQPTPYGDAVKHIKKTNKEINDLNDEVELNNKELRDPKLSKEDKESVKERNKEISKQIKELHNSKKSHEKIVNKHEEELSSDFYDQHNTKKELTNKIDDVVKSYHAAEKNDETEKMKKLRADFDELHGQLKKHLGETPSEDENDKPSDEEDNHEDADSSVSDWDDSDKDEEDSYSRALAKKTGYAENKFNKEGAVKKTAKEVAKKTQWVLNRLGSGLHIQDSSISDIVKNSPSRQAFVDNYERLSAWRKERVLKKIKKPLENHLRDMDDAIEDAEREVEKYETKEILSDVEKNKLRVAQKQLKAIHKEQRSAQDTYDKIIKTGDTSPRKRGSLNVDTKDDDEDSKSPNVEVMNKKRDIEDADVVDTKKISNDKKDSNNSIEYLKKLSSDKSSDDKDGDEDESIEGIDFKKDEDGKEEKFDSNEKLQNAIYAAQGEIERLGRYDSSEAESMIKSLEGAIEMGEKAVKSNDGIGYALKSLKNSYSKSKTIKESFMFLKDRTKTITLISESEEAKVEDKIDPSEYLKNTIGG